MIRNLLFDLGGVIMDIRRENCVEAFRALGMTDPDRWLGEYRQSGPFADIEDGTATPAMFHDSLRSIIGSDVSDEAIDAAFGKFLVGIPRHRLEELEALHCHYAIYMLSNTNPIMWHDGIARNFRQSGHDVDYYFDGVVRSYEAGVMKPDMKIFRTVIDRFGIKPEETLFVDDSQANLDAAAIMGFCTLLVPPGTEFYELLSSRISLPDTL
ncbi:MAG: HAD family phosphatase [Paramuribaculum sp.]|nr:HAD family phosphatase [Paramuribaculum sp.]